MAKYKALSDGFLKNKRIRKGDVFDLPEGLKPGKWMAELDEKGNVIKKKDEAKKADPKGKPDDKGKGLV